MRACGGRLARLGAATSILASVLWPAGGSAQTSADAGACCRELHSLYEASIFQIDAMRLRVTVDEPTGAAVERLVRGAKRTSALNEAMARCYRGAEQATIDMEFLVGVSGETFISNTTKAIRALGHDGSLSAAAADTAAREASERFAFLRTTGVRPGDRLQYRVVGDTVITTYRRGEEVLAVDRAIGPRARDAILATYFAPSSDFRKGLLDDAFRRP